MKLISALACGAVLAGCSNAGSQSPFIPAAFGANSAAPAVQSSGRSKARPQDSSGYVYVSNRSQGGASDLLVYALSGSSGSGSGGAPIQKITKGLVDAGGIAVDANGDVYVANGSAGNVLEFTPGGTSLVQTYSQGLTNPVDVAVANGTLYVADRGNASNGYAQQIFEYSTTSSDGKPLTAISGLGYSTQFNTAVAVDPAAAQGTFFASATIASAMPPSGACSSTGASGNGYAVAQNLFPTLWQVVPLSHNSQVSGVAFDSQGNMYAADTCAGAVDVYALKKYVWTYAGTVNGSFSAPFLLTVNDGFLAVPNAATGSSSGYVTVIDLSGSTKSLTLRSGLDRPIGASAGPAS